MGATIRCRFLFALLCAIMVFGVSAQAHAQAHLKSFLADPVGDNAAGGPDITGLNADVVGANLVTTLSLAAPFSPPYSGRADELFAIVLVDTDGVTNNPPPELAIFCPALASQTAPDYGIFLERDSTSVSEPFVFNAHGNDDIVGLASASYGTTSLTVTVPLATIHAGAAPIRVMAIVAQSNGGAQVTSASDCAGVLDAQPIAVGPAVTASGTSQAGATRNFRAPVAAARYDWDLDGDGIVDRSGAGSALDVSYPGAFAGNVSVIATAGDGSRTLSSVAITNAAPQLAASVTGAATQVCGDGDANPEPGESWRVPVRIANTGAVATNGGSALFAPKDRLDAAAGGGAIDGKLVVETPLVDVGTLAPGATVDSSVTVTLARDASCGSSYALAFSGGVDAAGSSPGASAALATFAVPATCETFTGSCGAAAKAAITPRQGLYYNPARPGNGLSNFIIPVAGASPIYFGAWFTGAADHTPTWYVIQGSLVGNVVVAPIYRFTRDVSAATFTTRSTIVGQAVVTMKSNERIAMLWQIGSKSGIEFMDYFVGGAAPAPNRTGAWYSAAESGWGQVIHSFVAGGTNYVFAVDYLYDGAGEPRWVLGQGTDSELTAGAAHQTFLVHCPGCPWIADWNSLPLASGSASEVFLDATHARTTTSFTFGPPLAGTWTRADLPIQLLTVPQ